MKLGARLGLLHLTVAGQALEDKLGFLDAFPTSCPGLSPHLWLFGPV